MQMHNGATKRYGGITSEHRILQSQSSKVEGKSLSQQIESIEDNACDGFRYPIVNESKTFIRRYSQYGEPKLLTFAEAVEELARFGYLRESIKTLFEEQFFIEVTLKAPEESLGYDYDNSLEYDTITFCIEQN